MEIVTQEFCDKIGCPQLKDVGDDYYCFMHRIAWRDACKNAGIAGNPQTPSSVVEELMKAFNSGKITTVKD